MVPPEYVAEFIDDVRARAAKYGRETEIRFAMNAFVIARDTRREAEETLREIVAGANVEAVESFARAVKEAGQASPEGKGMWSDPSFEDLVQYNDGFKPRLIGTPDYILLTGYLHFIEEVKYFGANVVPRVRALSSERGRTPSFA